MASENIPIAIVYPGQRSIPSKFPLQVVWFTGHAVIFWKMYDSICTAERKIKVETSPHFHFILKLQSRMIMVRSGAVQPLPFTITII